MLLITPILPLWPTLVFLHHNHMSVEFTTQQNRNVTGGMCPMIIIHTFVDINSSVGRRIKFVVIATQSGRDNPTHRTVATDCFVSFTNLYGIAVYGYCLDISPSRVSISIVEIASHDDVIKWKHFPRNWPFVRGIHRSPANPPYKSQWRGALCFLWSAPEWTVE